EPLYILMYDATDHEQIIAPCNELGIRYQLVKPLKPRDRFSVFSHFKPETVQDFTEHAPNVDDHAPTSHKVLIVEDNHTNMLLARILIERLVPQVKIIEAQNGLVALDYCKNEAPSSVFMDIQMPVMNGYEATKAIK